MTRAWAGLNRGRSTVHQPYVSLRRASTDSRNAKKRRPMHISASTIVWRGSSRERSPQQDAILSHMSTRSPRRKNGRVANVWKDGGRHAASPEAHVTRSSAYAALNASEDATGAANDLVQKMEWSMPFPVTPMMDRRPLTTRRRNPVIFTRNARARASASVAQRSFVESPARSRYIASTKRHGKKGGAKWHG